MEEDVSSRMQARRSLQVFVTAVAAVSLMMVYMGPPTVMIRQTEAQSWELRTTTTSRPVVIRAETPKTSTRRTVTTTRRPDQGPFTFDQCDKSSRILAMSDGGRLGNQIGEFAVGFALAKKYNRKLIISKVRVIVRLNQIRIS